MFDRWLILDAIETLLILGWPIAGCMIVGHFLFRRLASARTRFSKLTAIVFGWTCACLLLELAGVFVERMSRRLPTLPVLARRPADQPFTILALGESTMVGEPYERWCSPGSLVIDQLQSAFPNRSFRLEMLARSGDHLDRQLRALAQSTLHPDLILAYAGHNEFMRRHRPIEQYTHSWWDRWRRHTPGLRLVHRWVNATQIHREDDGRCRQLLDHHVASPAEIAAIHDRFRAGLTHLARWSRGQQIPCVLIVPASNESDFDPNRSVATGLAPRVQQQIASRWSALATASTPTAVLAALKSIEPLAPGLAEAQFLAGRAWQLQGEFAKARQSFQRAIDGDGFPIRATSKLQEIVRSVGRAEGAIVVDFAERLAVAAPVLGDEWFHDAHHPTLKGYCLMANEIVHSLQASGIVESLSAWTNVEPLTADRCNERLGLTNQDQKDILISRGRWCSLVFRMRFDPTFRRSKVDQLVREIMLLQGPDMSAQSQGEK